MGADERTISLSVSSVPHCDGCYNHRTRQNCQSSPPDKEVGACYLSYTDYRQKCGDGEADDSTEERQQKRFSYSERLVLDGIPAFRRRSRLCLRLRGTETARHRSAVDRAGFVRNPGWMGWHMRLLCYCDSTGGVGVVPCLLRQLAQRPFTRSQITQATSVWQPLHWPCVLIGHSGMSRTVIASPPCVSIDADDRGCGLFVAPYYIILRIFGLS